MEVPFIPKNFDSNADVYILQMFSTLLCLENLPQHLKEMRVREEKRGKRGGKKDVRGREENILIENLPQHLKN